MSINYLSILESLHDAIIVVLKDGTIAYVNEAYTQQFNVPKEKIIGKKLNEIEEASRILEVIRTGQPLLNDYSYVHSLKMHVGANMTPYYENGEWVGAVTIMKDINEFKKLQNELDKYIEYNKQLRQQLEQRSFLMLKSEAPTMKRAVSLAQKVAESTATILLTGESGVGKEIFARAIHEASLRHNEPFIPINIASIPDTLFESEMFGYEEGSFTGSKKGGKEGFLEVAHGGTLFLDEIAEMSLSSQAKLLRVIQEREFIKVGGTKSLPLDVRIICATNRHLNEEIKKGYFREDLYYRINVVPIDIPPLRERIEDLSYLINNIMTTLTTKYNKHVTLGKDVIEIFEKYDWPGNVRELSNVIEQMLVVSTDAYLQVNDIPLRIRAGEHEASKREDGHQFLKDRVPETITHENLHSLLEQTERKAIIQALHESRTRTEAIKKLGISRKAFYAKLKKYNIG